MAGGVRPGPPCRSTTAPLAGTHSMVYAPTMGKLVDWTTPSRTRRALLNAGSSWLSRGLVTVSADCRVTSVWPTRYFFSAVTAAKSKAASTASVIATTPATTLVLSLPRPWVRARRRPLIIIGIPFIAGVFGLTWPGQAEAVADGPLGVDQIRPVPGQLAPQVRDVGRHHRGRPAEVVVPHVIKQLVSGQDPPGVEHQVAQQPELGGGQLD